MFLALDVKDPTNWTPEEFNECEKVLPMEKYEELDHYIWAQGESDDMFPHPTEPVSPEFISPVMDTDAFAAALTWRMQKKGEAEGAMLWAHLGRGWKKLGTSSATATDRFTKKVFIKYGL